MTKVLSYLALCTRRGMLHSNNPQLILRIETLESCELAASIVLTKKMTVASPLPLQLAVILSLSPPSTSSSFPFCAGRVVSISFRGPRIAEKVLGNAPCFRMLSITGVCEITLLLRKPLPCSPAAETSLQPLIWCSEC